MNVSFIPFVKIFCINTACISPLDAHLLLRHAVINVVTYRISIVYLLQFFIFVLVNVVS